MWSTGYDYTINIMNFLLREKNSICPTAKAQ
jgi:hypothetical protein